MKTETFVIVNPTAGGGRALRAERAVRNLFALHGHGAEFTHSKSSEDIREQAARAAAEGFQYVVALGGDGAFHHVVEGLRGTDAIAGFFPAGNGNDIAEGLGIPADAALAADAFLKSKPRAVDLVRVRFSGGNEAHYIGAGGMGLDAQAAHLANTKFKSWPGVTRYLAGAFWTFFHEPAFELRAEIDGEIWNGRGIFAAVANGARYGSGVRIAPEAKMDDGWLDVVLVGEIGWMRLVEAIPTVLTSGDLRGFPEVQRHRGKRIRLAADRPAKVHGDGELLGESPAEFEVLPGALRVMTPQK